MKKIIVLLVCFLMLASCSSKSETKIENKTVTANDVLNIKSKDEMAKLLNCSKEEIDDVLNNLNVMNKFLPDNEPSGNEEYEREVDEDGNIVITIEEAASMVEAFLLTKDNWGEFVGGKIKKMESCYWNENDEESCEFIDDPEIGWIDGVEEDDNVVLKLRNIESGYEFEFDYWWSEDVKYEDGKFVASSFDENGKIISKEFNPTNYEVIEAHGILYRKNIDPEIIYHDDYENPYDDGYVIVKLHNGEIWQVGVGGLGSFAFENR